MQWVIGDIHGMLKPLEGLLRRIDAADSTPQLVFAGDYVNRGPQACGVVDLLLALPDAVFIRGNHDDVFDLLINRQSLVASENFDRLHMYRWFCNHGLIETFESYGRSEDEVRVPLLNSSIATLDAITEAVPDAHRSFFRGLPASFETEQFFVVHGKWPLNQKATPAGLRDSTRIPAALQREMLWGRFTDAEISGVPAWSKPGYFGHTPVQSYRGREADSRPIIRPRLALIDTGAALSAIGRLTAVCPQSGQVLQVDREGCNVD